MPTLADLAALMRAQREAKPSAEKPWYFGMDIGREPSRTGFFTFGGGSGGGKTYAQEHGARQGFDIELTATEVAEMPALPKPKDPA